MYMKRKIEDIVIFGAGGLGREVMWQIDNDNHKNHRYNILGFIDDTPGFVGQTINKYSVIGNTKYLQEYPQKLCVVICLGSVEDRKAVYNRLKENSNLEFPTILADSAMCSEFVEFGKGCIICNMSILTVNISVGDFVVVGNSCVVGHDVRIADYVTLYPNVKVSGNVKIASNTEIGVGASIIQKKNIGENVIIGAGAVVIEDIPSSVTAVGVPTKNIKSKIR